MKQMRQVLVTGAGGYIGQALTRVLVDALARGDLEGLSLTDLQLPAPAAAVPGLACIEGDLGDPEVLRRACAARPDTVFHLAGLTSRGAEDDFERGLAINVTATMDLFGHLGRQGQRPVLVYASSIAVFGTPLPPAIDDQTAPAPTLSYGTEKRMMELLLADLSRRGALDGRAVRLPSVVARPGAGANALSSFSSALIRELAEGRPYTCPIGPQGQMWLLSLPQCLEHLLLAARVDAAELPASRAWNLPALRASAAEVVQALVRRCGEAVATRLRYAPEPALQAQFAQWPPLSTPTAERLGMRADADLDALIERALADPDAFFSRPSPAP